MIGIHVGKTSMLTGDTCKSLLEALKLDNANLDMSAISLFMYGPQNLRKNNIAYNLLKNYCEEKNITIFPHGSYIAVGIWNVTKDNIDSDKSKKYIQHILDSLISGHDIDAEGIVIHVPRHPISTITNVMHILSSNSKFISVRKAGLLAPIILEMPASKPHPTLTYETPKKLNTFCKALDSDKNINLEWNICLDTCHLYAGGIDLSGSDSWTDYQQQLSPLTLRKIKLFHLNGAELKNFGTGKDGHIIPCTAEDAIWGGLVSDRFRKYLSDINIIDAKKTDLASQLNNKEKTVFKQSSLFTLVKFAQKNNIAMICEINDNDYTNTKFIIDLVKFLTNLS
jgi:endonuclease IV